MVRLRGKKVGEFYATAGVRQGCPVSPLIFAICVDCLLRRISTFDGIHTVRAFADDIGAVLADWRLMNGLLGVFYSFAAFSGLHLNLPKTILLPSGP